MKTMLEQSREAFACSRTDWDKNPLFTEAMDRAKELDATGLKRQASTMRCGAKRDSLSRSGFSEMTLEQAVGEVMGAPPSERFEPDDWEIGSMSMPMEWSAFPESSRLHPVAFRRFNDKRTLFFRTTKWVCLAGTLAALKTPPPRGVTLFLKDLQVARAFDFFTVIAPQEMFLSPKEIDPLLLGGVCQPSNRNTLYPGDASYFAIAKWDKS